jgi:hypothetical protein
MRTLKLIGVLLFAVLLVSPAEARKRTSAAHPDCNILFPCFDVAPSVRGERAVKAMGGFGIARPVYQRRAEITHERPAATVVGHPSGCPARAFCGCGTAVRLLGSPVRSLWLAANWFRFPRAAPAPGMAAVRRGHVFAIEQVLGNGKVLAYDPNSGGHRTRIHVRSLKGFTVVNPRA